MRLTFERQFLLAGHALAGVSVAALATTHEVGLPYVLTALGALSWSFGREWRRRGPELSQKVANASIVAALLISLGPVVLRGASPVRAIAEFLLVLVALKVAARKQNRDWLQIGVLSFFQLLAAAALTVEPIFAVLFLAYLLLAPCVLVMFLLRREIGVTPQGARRLEEEPFVEPSLFRSIAVTTVVLFVSTVVIFIVFPRFGAGYFAAPFSGGRVLTGFSEEVGLGGLAALKQDDAVALRVTVDRPERFGDARWRGAVLDHFDGKNWRRRPQELRPLMRPETGLFVSPEPALPRSLVHEDMILEPQESAALFIAGRPIEIRGRFTEVSTDAIGNLRVLRTVGIRTRYQVLASLAPRMDPPTPETLALPTIDRRILELAREQVKGVSGDRSRAEALLGFFHRGFRYSLEPGDDHGEDPLVRFLFVTRTGFCEHFASAYAVMLRAVGIPSVVVNGYAGGEWNPYGNYFVIRQSDAHSWVEAYVDGAWQTLDPTPAAPPRTTSWSRRLADAIDAMEMRWYRYVINYTLEDQAEAALSLRDASRQLWESLSLEWWRSGTDSREGGSAFRALPWKTLLGLLAVASLAGWVWHARGSEQRSRSGELSGAALLYLRLLNALAARGLEKRPAETPLEFYRRIAPRLDGDSEGVARITHLYHEARFSGADASDVELDREVECVLASLEARDAAAAVRAG
jgi:transglutaminase-like putative cysteine protease